MTALLEVQMRAGRARARRRGRGFTLIELLVALTGGLFVSIAVFALARDASRFYQREGRLANATLGAVVGFERLRADIARAGFLASPNVQSDPLVCSRPPTNGPSLLADLASVRIIDGEKATTPSPLAENGRYPDTLLLSGSYSSSDEFPIRSVETAGAGYTVGLEVDTGAMARLGWLTTPDVNDRLALLQNVFATGRGLRIVDREGRSHFAQIASVTLDAAGVQPQIVLTGNVPLQFRDQSQTKLCGFNGPATGSHVSVINFIRYEVKNLAGNTNYAALYSASKNTAIAAYETQRTELVRSEVDANGQQMTQINAAGTTPRQELVAEYAVDFQLGVTAATGTRNSLAMQYFASAGLGTDADGSFATYAGAASAAGTQPQRIRAVRATLAVRSREPDRDSALPGYRIGLGSEGKAPFARIRTLQADVMVNNNVNAEW